MKAFHAEFKRVYDGNKSVIQTEIFIETKRSDDNRRVKFQFDFNCIPYVIDDLRRVWAAERDQRINTINATDKALGVTS